MVNQPGDIPTEMAAPMSEPRVGTAEIAPQSAMSIQALREKQGLSVVALAGRAGLLPDHLRAIEAGLIPTVPERQAIAAALNVPVEQIAQG